MWWLSGSRSVFSEFRQLKVDRFRQFGIPCSTLAKCESWSPPFRVESIRCTGQVSNPCNKIHKLRVIVPFHKAFALVFLGMLRLLSYQLQLMLQCVWPEVKSSKLEIAWANSARSLAILVR